MPLAARPAMSRGFLELRPTSNVLREKTTKELNGFSIPKPVGRRFSRTVPPTSNVCVRKSRGTTHAVITANNPANNPVLSVRYPMSNQFKRPIDSDQKGIGTTQLIDARTVPAPAPYSRLRCPMAVTLRSRRLPPYCAPDRVLLHPSSFGQYRLLQLPSLYLSCLPCAGSSFNRPTPTRSAASWKRGSSALQAAHWKQDNSSVG